MMEKITLGGREFDVAPLKLGQLRHLLDALDEMSGKSGGALIEAGAHVVAAGLQRSHGELTADAILDLEGTAADLNRAIEAVLRVAGLHQTAAGEAAPAGTSAPSSAGSTAP